MTLLLRQFSAVFNDHSISGVGKKVIHYDLNVFFFFCYLILKICWDRILLDINIFRQKKTHPIAREFNSHLRSWKLEPNCLGHMGNLW